MGKTISINRLLLAAFITAFSWSACQQKNPDAIIDPKQYSTDSSYLYLVMKKMVVDNMGPFKAKGEFDDNTIIFIDTILYSPDLLKAMVLTITENGNYKLLIPGNLSDKNYSGNYFFCRRQNLNDHFKVFIYSPWRLIHYDSFQKVKKRLHNECFRLRSKEEWSESEPKYNMNDKRFWSGDEFNSVTSDSSYIILN